MPARQDVKTTRTRTRDVSKTRHHASRWQQKASQKASLLAGASRIRSAGASWPRTEVANLGDTRRGGEQHVGGLDVAVDDAAAMQVLHAERGLGEQAQHGGGQQHLALRRVVDEAVQRAAAHELEDEAGQRARQQHRAHRAHDVRVRELECDACLLAEVLHLPCLK